MKTSAILLALAISTATAAPFNENLSKSTKTIINKRQYSFDLGSFTDSIPTSGSSSSSSGSGSSSLGSLGSFGSLGSLTGSSSSSSSSATKSSPSATGTSSSASSSESSSPTSTEGSDAPSDGRCKAVTLLFARGTGETGTMGTIIGPPLASALASVLGEDKVTSEGVDYPADAAGNADLGASGGTKMASQAQTILSSCPSTKLVLAGYSQGAMVVHNALSAQGLDGSTVAAIVAFGDPFNGQDFEGVDSSKVKEFCGSADGLCSSGGTSGSGSTHLSYGGDADAAAEFIGSVVGV